MFKTGIVVDSDRLCHFQQFDALPKAIKAAEFRNVKRMRNCAYDEGVEQPKLMRGQLGLWERTGQDGSLTRRRKGEAQGLSNWNQESGQKQLDFCTCSTKIMNHIDQFKASGHFIPEALRARVVL